MKNLYIIAETACSHDGSLSRLKRMIKFAVDAGFDAIQLQIWKKDKMLAQDHKDFNLLKKIEINYAKWQKIFNYIRSLSKKIDIICCVYELDTIKFCLKNKIKFYKIHSSDVGNIFLLKYLSSKAKRIDLSIGGCTNKEITKAVNTIKNKNCDVWLMYGIQLFPTDPKKINLTYYKKFSSKLKLQLGYQDHSKFDLSGYCVPSAAIGSGVKIIEKHITDFNFRKRTDGESAIEIKNYKNFVDLCRISSDFISEKNKKFSKSDLKYRDYSKKKIFFGKDLSKNHKIIEKDLVFLRTSKKGIIIDNLYKVLKKKLKRNVKKLQVLTPNIINR
ncbi:N-acetylneuraminate synthase family protein [Pelagibacterales bacterium SAG-MED08]|nr:N-acetylneuraminate synthase family protein [Pelagibacterales bacterium SAG-MED08]